MWKCYLWDMYHNYESKQKQWTVYCNCNTKPCHCRATGRGAKLPKRVPPPEVECVYLAPHHGSFFLNFDYALPPPRRKKLNPHECQILEPPPCFLLNSQADFYQFVSATQSTPFRKVPWHPNLHMLKFWQFHIFNISYLFSSVIVQTRPVLVQYFLSILVDFYLLWYSNIFSRKRF